MSSIIQNTVKKTFFYNFFPTKIEEEASRARTFYVGPKLQRLLVEIRDVHPPPMINVNHPWHIQKRLSQFEVESGKLFISFHDLFENILRYWNIVFANQMTLFGRKVAVSCWDMTDQMPKKYEGEQVYMQLTQDDNSFLACEEIMRDRNLAAGDYIGLYWDARESHFRIKLFARSGR